MFAGTSSLVKKSRAKSVICAMIVRSFNKKRVQKSSEDFRCDHRPIKACNHRDAWCARRFAAARESLSKIISASNKMSSLPIVQSHARIDPFHPLGVLPRSPTFFAFSPWQSASSTIIAHQHTVDRRNESRQRSGRFDRSLRWVPPEQHATEVLPVAEAVQAAASFSQLPAGAKGTASIRSKPNKETEIFSSMMSTI